MARFGAPSTPPEVRFWCLQTLGAWARGGGCAAAPPADAEAARAEALSWMARGGGGCPAALPVFLRNKAAQVVAALVAAEFPAGRWPGFFSEAVRLVVVVPLNYPRPAPVPSPCERLWGQSLVLPDQPSTSSPPHLPVPPSTAASLSGEGGLTITAIAPGPVDMLARVLGALDDDFISLDVPRPAADADAGAALKDALRASPGCLPALVSALCATAAAAATPDPRLAAAALHGLARLVVWADVSLFASPPVAGLLCTLVDATVTQAASPEAGPTQAPVRPACAAADVLGALVGKRMDAGSKLALVGNLGLAPRAAAWAATAARAAAAAGSSSASSSARSMARRRRLAAKTARLLATVAAELLDAWKRVENGAMSLGACGVGLDGDTASEVAAACGLAAALVDGLLPPLLETVAGYGGRPGSAPATPPGGGITTRVSDDDEDDDDDDDGSAAAATPSDDDDASIDDRAAADGYATVGFLMAYVQRVRAVAKRVGRLPPGVAEVHLPAILGATARGARWPASAPPGPPSPSEAEVEAAATDRRHDLFTLFRNAAAADPGAAVNAVRAALVCVGAASASSLKVGMVHTGAAPPPFEEVEAALACLFHLGEGAPDPALRADGALGRLVVGLATGTAGGAALPHTEHRLVSATLCEVWPRYARALADAGPPALRAAALSFLSPRCAGSTHPPLAARASYLFARFTRTLRQPLIPLLPDLLPVLEPHLRRVLATSPGDGSPDSEKDLLATSGRRAPSSAPAADDRLYLFEAAGLLLGQGELPAADQLAALESILLSPALSQIAAALPAAAGGPEGEAAADGAAAAVQRALDALGRAARGFAPPLTVRARPALGAALAPAADAALAVLRGAPHRPALRSRATSLIHRLVESLGDALLPALPAVARALLPPCLTASSPNRDGTTTTTNTSTTTTALDPAAVVDAAALLAQLASRYRGAAAPLMAAVLPDLASAAGAVLASPEHDWTGAAVAPRPTAVMGGGGHFAPPPPPRPPTPALSEVARERADVQRALLALAHALAAAGLGAVAVTSAGALLEVVLHGAAAHVDPATRRSCVQTVRRLVADAVAGATAGGADAAATSSTRPTADLDAFLRTRIIPTICLGGLVAGVTGATGAAAAAAAAGVAPTPSLTPPRLDARDGAVAALVGDAAALLVEAVQAVAALNIAPPVDVASMAAGVGLPPDVAGELAAAVGVADVKAAKSALRGGLLALAGVGGASAARTRVVAAASARASMSESMSTAAGG